MSRRFDRFADWELREIIHALQRRPDVDALYDEALAELDQRTGWLRQEAERAAMEQSS